MAKIKFHNGFGYYLKVAREARKRGIGHKLYDTIARLRRYDPGLDSTLVLFKDWAELSFTFQLFTSYPERRGCFGGGIIFHPGNTGPDSSLSVELNPSDEPHWSVHT